MPELEPYAAILRRTLSDRERNVLLLGRGGALNVMQSLDGVKSIEAAERLMADVRRKAERVVREVRATEAREQASEMARKARGSNTVGARSSAAVVDEADVPAERRGTIHEEAAGADGSPDGDPPPSAPAADSSFEVEEPEPAGRSTRALDWPGAVPAPPIPAIPSGVVGEVGEEVASRERWFEYMDLLFARAKTPDCPEHIFDRIEKCMSDGPPA